MQDIQKMKKNLTVSFLSYFQLLRLLQTLRSLQINVAIMFIVRQ